MLISYIHLEPLTPTASPNRPDKRASTPPKTRNIRCPCKPLSINSQVTTNQKAAYAALHTTPTSPSTHTTQTYKRVCRVPPEISILLLPESPFRQSRRQIARRRSQPWHQPEAPGCAAPHIHSVTPSFLPHHLPSCCKRTSAAAPRSPSTALHGHAHAYHFWPRLSQASKSVRSISL